jgi:23S rRNA (adenine2503-C2)-methyltransferase
MKPHMLETTPDQLAAWLAEHDEPRFRADQILDWVCAKRVDSFDAMANLSAELRTKLADAFDIAPLPVAAQQVSDDGETGKVLFTLADGEQIESVWMSDDDRFTFCISSQAGCPLDCHFCATGVGGFSRNLTVAEILGQVTALARITGHLRNVVFMGMGEPLLNLGAVVPALKALADERRFALGARRLTVSTAGITPGIRELATCGVRPNLALSLNSPSDTQRSEMMPVNRTHPLDEVLEACEDYADATGRRILLEYVLIGGVNTAYRAARQLGKIAHRLKALVNLIPFNPVPGSGYVSPTREEVATFRAALEKQHVQATERFRRGRDISAACGQLRGKHVKK